MEKRAKYLQLVITKLPWNKDTNPTKHTRQSQKRQTQRKQWHQTTKSKST